MLRSIVINNAQDLVEALRNHEDLRAEAARLILTDRLLALPDQFALLTSRFDEFVNLTTQAFTAVHARIDNLEKGQEQIREIALKALTASGQSADSAIKAQDMWHQARDMAREARDMAIQAAINSKRALEPPYERKVKPKLIGRCQQAFGTTGTKIIMDPLNEPTPEFHQLIQTALNNGSLTEHDSEEIQEADFVLTADHNRHAVVEASLTIDKNDIIRAAERAAIMSHITQGTAYAAVAAEEIDPELRSIAEDMNVTIFQINL